MSDARHSTDSAGSSSYGAALRQARESAGLTVEQVAASTRIRSTLVRALEDDDASACGGSVYARGHVRNIATAVGADPTVLVALFDRSAGAGSAPAPVAVQPEPIGLAPSGLRIPTSSPRERRGPNWLVAGTAAASVLLGLIVVGSLSGRDSTTPDALAGLSPPVAASPAASASPAPFVAQRPEPTGAQLRVRILGGSSWISIRNAAGTLFEGVVRDGVVKDFTDPTSLRVIVGNAGAVNLICGGKDLAKAGASGSVERFTCSRTGLAPI